MAAMDDADAAALQQRLDELAAETSSIKRKLEQRRGRGDADGALASPRFKRGGGGRRGGGGKDGAAPKRRATEHRRPSAPPKDAGDEGGRFKWVSGGDDAKSIARLVVGAALPSAVVGFPVALHSKYEVNVNTAVKGVAIAAKRCRDELAAPIACAPSFRENRNELTITVVELQRAAPDVDAPGAAVETLTVARATDYRVLAGAVAKRARAGDASNLRAIGAAAVFTAARAVATCREYLAEDAAALDVVAVPRFAKVQFDGRDEETTVLELVVFPSEDGGAED